MTEPVDESDNDNALRDAFIKVNKRVDNRSRARKQRRKQALAAGDGRSLRATGRTQQLNIKVTARLRSLLAAHVETGGLSLWIEEAVLAKLRAEGVQVDE
jgi:hypothetical protein